MAGARYTRTGLLPGSHTIDAIARREAGIEQIRLLLAEQSMPTAQVAAPLGVSINTAYGWLTYLKDLGEAHQVEVPGGGGRKLWALGRDPVTAPSGELDDDDRRAWIVPARQVGMKRHWMDEALFGPARGVAA